MNGSGHVVFSWYEDKVVDICGTDLFRVENESESYIASSNRDIRRVVEVSIDVDLKVVRVAVEDIQVRDCRGSSIESL